MRNYSEANKKIEKDIHARLTPHLREYFNVPQDIKVRHRFHGDSFDHYDASIEREDGVTLALLDYKRRHYQRGRYPTWVIDLVKVHGLASASRRAQCPAAFAVQLDDALGLVSINDVVASERGMIGRTDRASYEKEPGFLVPFSLFVWVDATVPVSVSDPNSSKPKPSQFEYPTKAVVYPQLTEDPFAFKISGS